jgi:hypothetical protein
MNARYLRQDLRDLWQGLVNSGGRKVLLKFLLNVSRLYILFENEKELSVYGTMVTTDVHHTSTLSRFAVFLYSVSRMIPKNRASSFKGNAFDVNSGGDRHESRQGHRLS